jgi:hypothetical protein
MYGKYSYEELIEAFQILCPLRVSFLDGNHRHAMVLMSLLNVGFPKDMDKFRANPTKLIENTSSCDVEKHKAIFRSVINYELMSAKAGAMQSSVIATSIGISKDFNNRLSKAVLQEDIHE